MAVVSTAKAAIRLAYAAYLWYPLIKLWCYPEMAISHMPAWYVKGVTIEYLSWLSGMDDNWMFHSSRFVLVLLEMRDYLGDVEQPTRRQSARKLARESISRAHRVLAASFIMTLLYDNLQGIGVSLPAIPWWLLINNYSVVLGVVGIVCASMLRSKDDCIVAAKMVLLFPVRILFPWRAVRTLYYFFTGRAQDELDNNSALGLLGVDMSLAGGEPRKDRPRFKDPLIAILIAMLFWLAAALMGPSVWWPAYRSGRYLLLLGLVLLLMLSMPWFALVRQLRLFLSMEDRDQNSGWDSDKIEACLNWSAGISQILFISLPIIQGRISLKVEEWVGPDSLLIALPVGCQMVIGFLIFAGLMARARATKAEWNLICGLLPRAFVRTFFPRQHAAMLYNYMRGRLNKLPRDILSEEQRAMLDGVHVEKDRDKEQAMRYKQLDQA